MQLIAHRKNTIGELVKTPTEYGIEIDLRSIRERLVVHHDPFVDGVDFDKWIKHYNHRTLILNIKEEGIENRVREVVIENGIEDFFFLDLSFPFLIKMINSGEKRVAVRFSEYESIESIRSLKGKVKWVWIDCFSKLPINDNSYEQLKNSGFKLCLVSPELQNRVEDLIKYKNIIIENKWDMDAVCTKFPEAWQ